MPFPVGMVTRVVSFAPFLDLSGNPIRGKIRVVAARALVWGATGATLMRQYAEVDIDDMTVTMTLPTTDQPGIEDGDGNSVTGWTYTASYLLPTHVDPVPDTTFLLPLEGGGTLPIPRDVSAIVFGGTVTIGGGGGGGATVWGGITGTLSSQTDLQTALNGKQAAGSYAAAVHGHVIGDTTGLQTALDGKAPLADPVFTGNPTAPTPATADNDTSIATTAFVKAQAYAPLASPALTGTPTAPTASQGTNTTQLATTAYVQTESGLLVPKSLVDAKGDLIVASAADTVARLGVGANGTVLTADSAEATGVKWAAAGAGSDSGSATKFNTTAEWREPYRHENATNAQNDERLRLWPLWIPFDFTLTGMATRWGADAGGGSDTVYNVMYSDAAAGFRPGSLFKATSAIVLGTGETWAAETFTGVNGSAGLYWIGHLPILTNATRTMYRVRDTDFAPWVIMPAGTGSTPSLNIGNSGVVAEQQTLTTPPSTFAGSTSNDSNDGKTIMAFWLKIDPQ